MGREIYVAKTSGIIVVDGRRYPVSKGRTRVREGHPLLAGREHQFEVIKVDYDIEQGTAAPGERRNVKVPEGPQHPPTSGPGSGAPAWREHAATVTGRPVEDFADVSRDELIEQYGG